MRARSFNRSAKRTIRTAFEASARKALGKLEHDTDTFILTFGQFSLIDAVAALLDQTGSADVVIATWTVGDAHLEHLHHLLESSSIRSLRLIVDRSFETRQPECCYHMRRLFGADCIRAIRTHAKFALIRNAKWNVVVRTSMNLNDNLRLENLEVTDDVEFAEFFQRITNDIFREVAVGENKSSMPLFASMPETVCYPEVAYGVIKHDRIGEPSFTHALDRGDERGAD